MSPKSQVDSKRFFRGKIVLCTEALEMRKKMKAGESAFDFRCKNDGGDCYYDDGHRFMGGSGF